MTVDEIAAFATDVLVSRGMARDQAAAVAQAVSIARRQQITAADGSTVAVPAASVCVHGDTLGAVLLARQIRRTLEDAGITVAPFAAP